MIFTKVWSEEFKARSVRIDFCLVFILFISINSGRNPTRSVGIEFVFKAFKS